MKQFIKNLIFVFLVLSFFAFCQVKRIYILDINKGEMPNDTHGAEIVLSDENVIKEGDLSLKIKWVGGGWVGDWQPKKSNWLGMRKIKFNIFNSSDKERVMSFVIKDEKSERDRNSWGIIFFKINPGMNKIELDIDKLKTKDGKREMDLSKIRQWHFSYCFFPEDERDEKKFEDLTVYISNLRVESE